MSLSVIYVNYNSTDLLKESVRTLKEAGDECEVIVVDNASRPDELDKLKDISGIRTILMEENTGFARGSNEGARTAAGDYLLFLNPDTLIIDSAHLKLMEFLKKHPEAGAAGPRIWWDRGKTIQLPPAELPGLRTELYNVLSVKNGPGRHVLKKYLSLAKACWCAESSLRQNMLSGAAIMIPRRVFQSLGGFDEGFRLYYEDADLCRRISASGKALHLVSEAEVVHIYNQSARQSTGRSMELFDESGKRYLNKHLGVMGRIGLSLFSLAARVFQDTSPSAQSIEVPQSGPMSFDTEGEIQSGVFLFAVSLSLYPSAGAFFDNGRFELPKDVCAGLGEGTYWVGMLDDKGHEIKAFWRVEKTCPRQAED